MLRWRLDVICGFMICSFWIFIVPRQALLLCESAYRVFRCIDPSSLDFVESTSFRMLQDKPALFCPQTHDLYSAKAYRPYNKL